VWRNISLWAEARCLWLERAGAASLDGASIVRQFVATNGRAHLKAATGFVVAVAAALERRQQ